MIKYTETPLLQRESKEIMVDLQRKYGIDKVIAQNDNLVLIGDDWCYISDEGVQLVTRALAAKLCMRLGENDA